MMDTTEYLRQRFYNSFSKLMSVPQVESLFNDLAKNYNEKSRKYHNLNHISACFKHFDSISEKLDSPHLVETALWFHDVIYNPLKSNNELKSAQYALDVLQATSLSTHELEEIYSHILSTIHPSQPSSLDQKYLIDIDLSILAADTKSYGQYKELVRQEYSFVPNLLYKRGRKKLLNSLLLQNRLYHSDHFFEIWEDKARNNLQQELESLS